MRDHVQLAPFRKASRSNGAAEACVEVAPGHRVTEGHRIIGVRDSKNRSVDPLVFDATIWNAFTKQVKAEQFDL
jgi:hypothetical protein